MNDMSMEIIRNSLNTALFEKGLRQCTCIEVGGVGSLNTALFEKGLRLQEEGMEVSSEVFEYRPV